MQNTQNSPQSFTLSTSQLYYTDEIDALKIVVKNVSLRTTSYEIMLQDQQHFKAIATSRTFSLAPGISKQVTIKHICSELCQIEARQILQAKIRDCHGKWQSFECRCSNFTIKKKQQLVQYPTNINLGQFDQKTSFNFEIKNISNKNLKIVFQDQQQLQQQQNLKSPIQSTYVIQNNDRKLNIKNLTKDCIILLHQSLKFQFQLFMGEHGQLQENIQFYIIAEQSSNKYIKRKTQDKQQDNPPQLYRICLTGVSVSKKLLIRDQCQQVITQIRNQLIVGTSKSSHFFIQTQYHQDISYTLQAYFQQQTPDRYAQKWKYLSIQLIDPNNKDTNKQHKMANKCQGILKKQSINKIQYKVTARYTQNDQNYVSKYSKLQFQDDTNALRMRNSQYAKKYQNIQVKIIAKIQSQASLTHKPIQSTYSTNKNIKPNQTNNNIFQIMLPLRFTLVNPSLRCKITQQQQNSTCITILNQTKINIPYKFPVHSLYRILNINSNNQYQSFQSILNVNKKEVIIIKWMKDCQRCPVYMQLPSFDLVLYQVNNLQVKNKNVISLPASRRRPMTSISSSINAKIKQNQNNLARNAQSILNHTASVQKPQPCFTTSCKPASLIKRTPQTPFSTIDHINRNSITKPQQTILWTALSKKVMITKQIPVIYQSRRLHEILPTIDELSYLIQSNKMVKNTHTSKSFLLQIIDVGYLHLQPGQFYVFDSSIKCSKSLNEWGSSMLLSIRYKIYGHSPTYSIKFAQPQTLQFPKHQTQKAITQKSPHNRISLFTKARLASNMFQSPPYQIMTRQIKMSFKQSKQQFQIVQPILIKNCSTQILQVNCISIDGQYFKCKEVNGVLNIKPDQVGEFKIGFQPQNTIKLSVLNQQAPQQLKRKAIVKSQNPIVDVFMQNSKKIKKQIKLLINKNVQVVTCIGQIIEKNCSIRPSKINLTNCKYGSPEVIQTMIITNTSSHKINYIIQNPSQITVKPKSGCILPKCTQNCTIIFKPSKKISNFESFIKIFIGGSHLEMVPLLINVQDPEIYIRQTQLMPVENAICGTQVQQLNVQMTIINNNPSQSLIQINLRDTPLYLGFTKNHHSPNSKIVLQNFIRCSQIIQQTPKPTRQNSTSKSIASSIKSIANEESPPPLALQNTMLHLSQDNLAPQVCSISVQANSFLIVPLTLRLDQVKIGQNTIKVNKNIANLIGYGQIKSPQIIRYICNKTLLQINPYKFLNQIVLTQSQKNYQISLKNMADRQIKVKTKIKHIQQHVQPSKQRRSSVQLANQLGANQKQKGPYVVCTYKDIDECLKPQCLIDLNMSFICFQSDKKSIKTAYQLTIYVKQFTEPTDSSGSSFIASVSNDQNQNDGYMQYFKTVINVIVPEPFLQISPSILVLPTVGVNTWSRQSFFIRNNGYKEIYIKIKKPVNITFQFECQIVPPQAPANNTNRSNRSNRSNQSNQSSQSRDRQLSTSHKQNIVSKNSITSLSKDKKANQPSIVSAAKQLKPEPRLLENQLTKINNTIQVRVCFKCKTTMSFKCILEIQDNFHKKYQLAIAGTCTDSPFFVNQGNPVNTIRQYVSSSIIKSYSSDQSLFSSTSSRICTKQKIGNRIIARNLSLQATDIEDLLFLNNWISSLIPQLSNQSTFFYIWLTKPNNLIKFLKEFNVSLFNKKGSVSEERLKQRSKQRGGGRQKGKQKQKLKNEDEQLQEIQYGKMSLTTILEHLKQQGYQLNSIRVDLLEKADQMQWLTFMWFFFSKSIVTNSFLPWFGKSIGCRQVQQITYNYIQKNYQQLLTILMTSLFQLKKQQNDNKAIDWKYLLQNFEPLLQNFKHIESRRHLILSMNIMYHKLSNIQNQVLQISDFQFVMNIKNSYNRKVRYFLQCDTKILICEQSSNKIMPAQTLHGYSFIAEQNQKISFTFSLRNYPINALAVITKCAIDLMNVIMWNNVIWDPIVMFKIRLKRKDDIVHNVKIECQTKASQEWVYKFQAKMSAEYRVFFQVEEGSKAIRLSSSQPGYLKKGQNTILRVLYNPENMGKCSATLRIANTMVKQVFKIQGVPLHSSKIQFEKSLKIVQNQQHQQQIVLPWQIQTEVRKPNTTAKMVQQSSSSRNLPTLAKQTSSTSQNFTIKLVNLNSQSQPLNKYQQCILKKSLFYNPNKKQLALHISFLYQKLIRNLQLIFQISHPESNENRLIRLIIDIIPKPIFIMADIQCQFNSSVVQTLKLQNIAKVNQTFAIKYGYIKNQNKEGIDKELKRVFTEGNTAQGTVLMNTYKGLFDVIKIKNNQIMSFNSSKSEKLLDYVSVNVKFNPNENNCLYNGQRRVEQTRVHNTTSRSNKLTSAKSLNKKKTAAQARQIPTQSSNQTQTNLNKLPFFYLSTYYHQSLYQVTYIFKPTIKSSPKKIQQLVEEQQKNLYHQCQPLVKYPNNIIYIQNSTDYTMKYEIQTDLYQISGSNSITISPHSIGRYTYQIYSLHLGKKQGKIQFKQTGTTKNVINQILQFTVTIVTSAQKNSQQSNQANKNKPKNASLQEGLRIYNEYFKIVSTIRKSKVFTIGLANLSEKQIQYEVRCDSQYLHPIGTHKVNNVCYVKIPKYSECQLQVEYLPYFVGQKQAKLYLYNPYQPQIAYKIDMVSQQAVQNITKQMSKIGQNKPIYLHVQNPFPLPSTSNSNSTSQKQPNTQSQLQLQLISASLNNKKIPQTQYFKHFKLFQQSSLQNMQTSTQNNTQLNYTKLKLRFKSNQHNVQGKNNRKIFVLFMSNQLLNKYVYQFVFNTVKFGQYLYKVCYTYPIVQRMQASILYTQDNIQPQKQKQKFFLTPQPNSNNITSKSQNKVTVSLPFINRFNKNVQIYIKSNLPQLAIKLLSVNSNTNSTPLATTTAIIQNQNNLRASNKSTALSKNNPLFVTAYAKEVINLEISNIGNVSELEVQVRHCKNQQFVWVYPITIYKVFQIPQRKPILITGQARLPIFQNLYPLIVYNCSKIQLFVQKQKQKQQNEAQKLQKLQELKLQVKLKQDTIRKRKPQKQKQVKKVSQMQEQQVTLGKQMIENSSNMQVPKNKGEVIIPKHKYLTSQYFYEMQIEINSATAMNLQGYFYLYQNGKSVSSRNISPAVSEKQVLIQKQTIPSFCSSVNSGNFVEKIPFILKVEVPRMQTLQFEADVGQKSTIKIKLDTLSNNTNQNQPLKKLMQRSSKQLDSLQNKLQVKIELHNNKNRQFSAFYNEKQQAIQVTYRATEYSGLKKGKLQIYVSGIYSQYELIGKFPNKQFRLSRKNSKPLLLESSQL